MFGKKELQRELEQKEQQLGYNTSIQNKINFKASEFGEPGFMDKFQNGMAHNFSIKLPDFTLLKYINVAPNVSYGMNWFFRKSEAYFDPETNSVKILIPVLVKNAVQKY